ncbi:RNA polymerase sigma factor [Isoptericola aurantiacus]|uniref:RNA polymerase sigma factor n=1 Tax=Isoptericola aurantiacus TaxID=3377839 RepID=UPI00383A4048
MTTSAGTPPAARLDALWDACAGRVQAYALRHTDPDTAQDVVSDTFLVAWRRLDEVPDPPLPWLLVVARNHLRNAERAHRRRRHLAETLTRLETATAQGVGVDALAAERDGLLRALATLTTPEREALLLVAWDGLTAAEAAQVSGCSRATFAVRLHRARRRMAAAENSADEPGLSAPGRDGAIHPGRRGQADGRVAGPTPSRRSS